ncbi:hypothetical protein BDV93DRAFT_496167 [Ceratobasidium sp. AG-I]|nr:hypothetical protein BDV93DRAFT_496167 [Ceratobasidium sp. AG-I]
MAQRFASSSRAGLRFVNVYAATPLAGLPWVPPPGHEGPTAQTNPPRRMGDRNASWLIESTANDWTLFVHPDGSRYWRCFVGDVQVISDIEPPLFTQKSAVIELLQHAANDISGFSDADNWEIHFTGEYCTYIHRVARAASSENQTYTQFRAQVQSGANMTSFSFRAETMYWAFVESHPNHRDLFEEDSRKATEALTWSYADRLLYEGSNAPFEKENAREMLDLIEKISNLAHQGSANNRAMLQNWYCAAVLRVVAYDRRHSHFGQRNVAEMRGRAQSDDTDSIIPFKSLIGCAVWHLTSFISFGSPFGYFKRIVNVDRTSINEGINVIRWRSFVKEMCQEWADSNLLATVLVSATVSLLAIPGLNGLAQIAGFLSAFCALGSVLSGMLLISNHQAQVESSGTVAVSSLVA